MGAVAFGFGGCLLICFFLPCYEKLYDILSGKWKAGIALVLLVVFIIDATYCAISPNVGYGISEQVQESMKMVDEIIIVY